MSNPALAQAWAPAARQVCSPACRDRESGGGAQKPRPRRFLLSLEGPFAPISHRGFVHRAGLWSAASGNMQAAAGTDGRPPAGGPAAMSGGPSLVWPGGGSGSRVPRSRQPAAQPRDPSSRAGTGTLQARCPEKLKPHALRFMQSHVLAWKARLSVLRKTVRA